MSSEMFAVFIDAKSMHQMMFDEEKVQPRNFDYSALLSHLNGLGFVVSAHVYMVVRQKNDLLALSATLTKMGYDVHREVTANPHDSYWNLVITAAACAMSGKVDRIILGTNYAPVVNAIKDHSKVPVDILSPKGDINCLEFVYDASH